jgi:prepilin-type N-terminal cleavage/methylation domain-containing protein
MARFARARALRPAFTLVELLVVVAVIALLVGLMLPALARVRRTGLATADLSNLRGLAVAHLSYMNVNEERFVDVGLPHGSFANPEQSFVSRLRPYFGGSPIAFRGPLDESAHWSPEAGGEGTPVAMDGERALWRTTSYGMNNYLSRTYSPAAALGDGTAVDRLAQVRSPEDIVCFLPMAERGDFASSDHPHVETWDPRTGTEEDSPRQAASQVQVNEIDRRTPAASAEANYSFLDGRVATRQLRDVYRSAERNLFDPALQLARPAGAGAFAP